MSSHRARQGERESSPASRDPARYRQRPTYSRPDSDKDVGRTTASPTSYQQYQQYQHHQQYQPYQQPHHHQQHRQPSPDRRPLPPPHQQMPYQQIRSQSPFDSPFADHNASRPESANSANGQQAFWAGSGGANRPSQQHAPFPRHSPEEQAWGMNRLLAPFRSYAYNDVDPGLGPDRSLAPSVASTTNSLTNSRRESFSDDVRFLDSATGRPVYGQDYSRVISGSNIHNHNPESIPGTPVLAPPTPTWMHNSRSSSPVASSYHLPLGESGGRSSNVSMASMASTPYRSERELMHLFPDSAEMWDRDWVRQGYIAKLHARDDKDEWPNWKRYLFYTVPFLALATLGTYWLYFILRIMFVIDAQRVQGKSFPLAWVFVSIEISVAIPTFLQMFWMVFILKGRSRPKLRLVGNDVPTVDVFITCCGEDTDLVMDTTRAACDIDYPPDRFRVVVLDDGNSADLRECVEALNATYPNVAYRARPKFPGVPHHFKAGNLNYGLEVVKEMPGGASKFMAALDADMIPEQHWLRAIMPHMLEDDKLALACPPQLFYNVPAGDPLCQSLDFFVNVSEPIKDALGVAWCTGSGYIVRRAALEEIGCFPQGSLAEDVATSTMLLGRGWKCAYIHEPLQFGTVPEDFGSHLKQRTRWAIGTVETSIRLNFCLWGDNIKKLTGYQRMSSIIYAILSLYNIPLTISLFALPVVLLSGNALVAYANLDQLRWLIRACFLALVVNRITELAMFLPSGYATGQRGARSQIWMAPYITVSIIRSFVLPSWCGGQKQAFKPTGSLKSELNERNPAIRAGVWQRLRVIMVNYMAGYHLFYVYLVLTAVTLTTLRCIFSYPTTQEKLLCLLIHAWWPPIAWIITISAFWIPITYAINPPSVPDRERLLQRNHKTDIAHPTRDSKKIAFRGQTARFELEYLVSTAFTTALFVATWFVGLA